VTDRQVLVEVEHAFGADPSSMVIMMTVPEDLLMLPDLRAADRVFNKGLPLVGSGFTLFFKRTVRSSRSPSPSSSTAL
jgi:hypothetical protein